jgi:enoyl-[acyl-carrier protein] reductase/trans-2-enoyl-CoA reductase (NAD+)
MDPVIQKETINMMTTLSNESLLNLEGTKMFLRDFYQINGFEFDEIDYELDIDIDKLSNLKPE